MCHDGPPAHYSRLVTHRLKLTFPERWIGRCGHVHWPPRSADLTPLDFCLWGWMKSEVYKEKVNTRDELVARIMSKNAKTTSGELHVLVPRGLKSALKSMVWFLNTYFELLQFTEIIYVTNKCNQCVICLSFIPFVRIFMPNIQTALSPHPLKTGHTVIWTYLLGMVHTTTS